MKKINLILLAYFAAVIFHLALVVGGSSSKFVVHFIDVGQGDAILIGTPDGYWGLIDGGRGGVVLNELDRILSQETKQLDFVLSTHPDADHIEGLIAVLDRYRVNNVFWQKSKKATPVYHTLLNAVRTQNIPNYELRDIYDFRLGCCVVFDVIWPLEGQDIYNTSEVNNISTAVLLRYKDLRVWLGGDLSAALEEEISSRLGAKDLPVQVIKVGHHGSRTSTSREFLSTIRPQYGIISSGKNNSYGHPHQLVLEALELEKVMPLRTDQLGTISLTESPDGRFTLRSNFSLEEMLIQ